MQLGKLKIFFETSPAMRLLRSPHAPYIVDFVHQQFKQSGKIAISYSDLLAALIAYREWVQESDPDILKDKPETYLAHWCANDTRWLLRTYVSGKSESGKNEAVYQLTSATEDVLAFLDRVLDQEMGFVGTESRLKLVIDTLSDVVVGASDDPETRLEHLRAEKQRIAQEIEQIESEGCVTRYQPAQLRDRFNTAISLLKELQGDFRAVEEKFKEITQQVQQRQFAGRDTRGGILEFALDAEDVLKREDQGVSFYAFVDFILSPTQQEKLQQIIQQIAHIQELAEHVDGLETVQRMVPSLLAEAEKVMRTNQRLSATLRRLLDSRGHRERQRIAQLLREIRGVAASLANDPPRNEVQLEVETKIEVASPFAKTFWSEPPRFATIDLTEHVPDIQQRAQAFQSLARMQRLDWKGMQANIRRVLQDLASATLGDVLAEHPPQSGVIEVLGYLQIAREGGHHIQTDAVEEIKLPPRRMDEPELLVRLPLVTFVAGGGVKE